MAGEMMDSVALASGELAGVNCIKQMMENEAKGGPPVTSAEIKKECVHKKTSAVSNQSAANTGTMGRNRLFYDNSSSLRGYYYLPYYINYSYTTTDYTTTSNTSSANDICKLILGVSCKKANKWWNTYFDYDYTNNYRQYNQYYNQGCSSWLAYNYSNYGYGNSSYGSGYGSGYSSGLSTNSFYYNPSSWNNNWYGCYNYYY